LCRSIPETILTSHSGSFVRLIREIDPAIDGGEALVRDVLYTSGMTTYLRHNCDNRRDFVLPDLDTRDVEVHGTWKDEMKCFEGRSR
jgi:hypothetical protein